MMTVHDILERARASGQRLTATEAGVLFSAAVRLAAAQGATLRSRLVQVDDHGVLHLVAFDDQQPEAEMGYLAPELLGADAPRKSEPRVQVYAAGALGYELLTGRDPRDGLESELPAPLGDIVRMALSPDKRERFGDLTQLFDAVESAQPRLAPEAERTLLASLLTRSGPGAALTKEALAKLIAQFGEVQKQLGKLSTAQREVAERLDRFEDGQRLLPSRARAPVAVPLLAGLLGAGAAIAGAWALGLLPGPGAQAPREPEPVAAAPADAGAVAVEPAESLPAPAAKAPAAEAPEAARATGSPADGGAAASDERAVAKPEKLPDAGAAAPAGAKSADADPKPADAEPAAAETKLAAADAKPPAAAADASPPPAKPARAARSAEVSAAMMAHAVAQSQVKRGEAALEQNRVDEAIASFNTALENEPNNGPAHRGLGTAYSMQSNETMAIQAYEQYLRVQPAARDAGEIRKVIEGLKSRAKIGGGEEK